MDNRQCVDIHAHYYPESFIRLMAEEGASAGAQVSQSDDKGPVLEVGILRAGPLARKFIDLDLRVAEMDDQTPGARRRTRKTALHRPSAGIDSLILLESFAGFKLSPQEE